jgi:hypothetical protein
LPTPCHPCSTGRPTQALGFTDWTYDLVECDEQGLAGYVESRGPEWAGLSLTMPLKRTVLPLLDHVDHLAAATGGANTVVFRPEGRYGYNTDVQGIVDALTEAGAPAAGSVTIIGAGATACSALAAVGELGGAAPTSWPATRPARPASWRPPTAWACRHASAPGPTLATATRRSPTC